MVPLVLKRRLTLSEGRRLAWHHHMPRGWAHTPDVRGDGRDTAGAMKGCWMLSLG